MIFHVTEEAFWNRYREKEEYLSLTFSYEGFIHCSDKNQLAGVLTRYFSGKTNLVLLHIDEKALKARLVYEPSTGGELFPHIYGPINSEAIIKVERLNS